jgi:hypothetical protein
MAEFRLAQKAMRFRCSDDEMAESARKAARVQAIHQTTGFDKKRKPLVLHRVKFKGQWKKALKNAVVKRHTGACTAGKKKLEPKLNVLATAH